MSVAKKIFAYKSHAWKAGPYRCYFLPVLDLWLLRRRLA
jgi:hypothetical protein